MSGGGAFRKEICGAESRVEEIEGDEGGGEENGGEESRREEKR